eukprot:gene1807-1974_t
MFQSVVRRSAPIARNVRMMSHGHDAQAEAARWKKLSFGMVGLSAVFGAFTILTGHHHEHARDDLPYMHIRAKPYPWRCDCSVFDGKCWEKCDAESK